MAGIPQSLRNQIRQVLLAVDEINNPNQLRAFFVTEDLYPFRSRLKIADSSDAQADLLINELFHSYHIKGENALVLLLQALTYNYDNNDARHEQLLELAAQLRTTLATKDDVRTHISLVKDDKNYPPIQLRPPASYQFVDRKEILKNLLYNAKTSNVICIFGAPGIGKTALVNAAARLLEIRGQCTLLITSRDSNIVRGPHLELQPLSPEYSVTLLQSVSGRTIDTVEEKQAARDICAHLGYLPLAIRIWADWAGSRAHSRHSLVNLHERLAAIALLDLRSPILDIHTKDQTVRASFDLSWENLESDQLRNTFAAIGVFAGEDWDDNAVAAILNVDRFVAQNLLDELVNKCLLEFGHTEERYSAHTLLRNYAKEKLTGNNIAFHRAADYFCNLVVEAYQHLEDAEIVATTQRLNLEMDNIQGIWKYCARQQNEHAAEVILALFKNLWGFLIAEGHFELFANLLDCADSVAKKINDTKAIVEIQYARATFLTVQQSADITLEQLNHVAKMFEKQGDQIRLCAVWVDLAYLCLGTGALIDAEQYTQKALTLAKALDQPRELGDVYWMLGNILAERRLATEALGYFEKALTYFQSIGNLLRINVIEREIGSQQRVRGNNEAALLHFQKALKFFEESQRTTNIDFTLLELAHTYLGLSQVAEAEQCFTKAMNNAQSRENSWILGAAMCGLAEVWTAKGNTETSIAWYKRAMTKARELNAPQKQAIIFRGIGEVFARQNQLKEAAYYFRQALDLPQQLPNKAETLFAISYLLTNRSIVGMNEIANIVKKMLIDDHERAILLVTIAQFMRERHPELVIEIGELLRNIAYPLMRLELPKSLCNNKEIVKMHTVGDLLAALIQKTVEFSTEDAQTIVQMLRSANYWPQTMEIEDVAYFVSTKRWGGGGGCFPLGTQILLPNNKICSIEALQVGMSVLSKNVECNEIGEGVVSAIFYGKTESYYYINRRLRITGTHQIYTDRGWLHTSLLHLGDSIYDANGHEMLVEEIQLIQDRTNIYNIEVETLHTFFAEGVLVHNPGALKHIV